MPDIRVFPTVAASSTATSVVDCLRPQQSAAHSSEYERERRADLRDSWREADDR